MGVCERVCVSLSVGSKEREICKGFIFVSVTPLRTCQGGFSLDGNEGISAPHLSAMQLVLCNKAADSSCTKFVSTKSQKQPAALSVNSQLKF